MQAGLCRVPRQSHTESLLAQLVRPKRGSPRFRWLIRRPQRAQANTAGPEHASISRYFAANEGLFAAFQASIIASDTPITAKCTHFAALRRHFAAKCALFTAKYSSRYSSTWLSTTIYRLKESRSPQFAAITSPFAAKRGSNAAKLVGNAANCRPGKPSNRDDDRRERSNLPKRGRNTAKSTYLASKRWDVVRQRRPITAYRRSIAAKLPPFAVNGGAKTAKEALLLIQKVEQLQSLFSGATGRAGPKARLGVETALFEQSVP